MSTQDPDPSAQPPAPEPSFPFMQDVPDHQAQPEGTLEARDIHATNVVSGSQYIQQQTIYQIAGNTSEGGQYDSPVVAIPRRLGARPLFEQQATSSTTTEQQDRARLLKALGKAYREALESSLQGVASIRLKMRERLDLTPAQESVSWQLPQKEQLLPEGTTILDVHDEANTGLLILGNPGAGKSTLLYELAQALIKRAQQDEQYPIPVVLNLSLWAAKRLPLEDWIVEQLELRYAIPRKLGKRWQQDERWLLLLDGLDEVALAARPACVEAINTYLSTRAHLVSPVVCSRLEDYDTLSEPLRLPSVVVVQPLTSGQADAYLGTAGAALAAVREVVQRNAVLHELLTTPLMLNVVTLAYRGKAVADLPQLGSAEEQQQHIFANYLQRTLPASGKRSLPSRSKIQHSLVWLAQQMRQRSQSILYLEQLQPDWLSAGWTQQIYTWLGIRLPAILIGSLVSLVADRILGTGLSLLSTLLLGGVVGGLLCSIPIARSTVTPSRIRRPLPSLLAIAALLGLLVGLGLPLLSSSSEPGLLPPRPTTEISFGLGTVLLTLLLARWPPSSHQAASPAVRGAGTRKRFWRRLLANDALRPGLLVGGLYGLGPSLSQGLFYALSSGLAWGLCGVAISLLLVHTPMTIVPTDILTWSWKRLWSRLKQREHTRETLRLALVIGLLDGLGQGLSVGLGNASFGLFTALSYGLSAGLGQGVATGLSIAGSYWLLLGLLQGVSSTTFREHQRTIPNQGIRRSGRNSLFLGIVAAIIAAVIGGGGVLIQELLSNGLIQGLDEGLSSGPSAGLSHMLSLWLDIVQSDGLNTWLSSGWQIGLATGLLVAFLMGGLAWWRHWVLRFLLWRGGAIPWHYVSMLDQAAQRILLHKVGGGYRFLHDLFRDYLATLEPLVLSGAVDQGVPQIDTAHREEAASPPAPSRRTGFNQEKRIAALLNVVILLIALAGGVSIFSGVHQSVNDASASATAQVEATATVQVPVNATAEALANALPIAYPPQNTSPVLNDPLQDNSQGNNWEVDDPSKGNCKFINRTYDINTHNLEQCFARSMDFTNFIYEIQMKIVKGDGGGIAFRADSTEQQYYYFAVNQDGSYSVHAYAGSGDIVLAQGSSPAIHRGLNQTNLVAAVVHGKIIELYVNHQRVAVVGGSTYTYGLIGVIVTGMSNQTEVIFQNAKVWIL